MLINLLSYLRLTCIVTLVLGAITPAHCNESPSRLNNKYLIKKLTAEDGFVSSEIYSIIQDTQGLLWFGTAENGVMRYDGRKVTLFEFDSLTPGGLSHNDAGNLMLDQNGKIWIGTWGGGANLYDPATGHFENFIHDPLRKDSIASNRIQSLFHDQEGTVWLGSYDKGLSKYLGNNRFKLIDKIEGDASSLSHSRIWDIKDHDSNNLWIATSYGLNLFDKNKQTFTHFFPQPENKTPTGANEIRSILITSQGKFYVATQQGPYLFEMQSGTFTRVTSPFDNNLGQVNSMIEDQTGDIWFVTTKGVFRQSSSTNEIEKLDFEHNNGLRIIFEDNTGTKWITSEVHGIYKLMPRGRFKSINSTELIAPNGLATDANGDIFIVSSLSELFTWKVASQQLEKLSLPIFSAGNGYTNNGITERPIILPDNNKNLWIAQDEGLAKYNIETKQLELFTYPKTDQHFRKFRDFRALSLDHKNRLWIGTYKNGVYLYDIATKTFAHLDNTVKLSHPEILEIFRDKKDNMWIGTGDGVHLWQEAKQQLISFKSDSNQEGSLLGNIVQDIHQANNDDIWIATQKGLNLFLPESKTFKHFNVKDGLPTSLIRAIANDSNGDIWLTTNKGVSKLEPLSGEVTNYGNENGSLGLNYYPSSLVRGVNDTLFTSSQRGIEFFNLASLETVNSEPNIVLTGFSKMGQSVKLERPYSYVTDIELSYLDYFFSFEFSVLDFISPNRNQYAYKLEGYDDNWIEIGNRNSASFTNLDGGSYRFLVKATNGRGEWGEKLLSINLHVSPSPWGTWWAYSLYSLIVVLFIFLAIYLRTRLQQSEIKRQKQFVFALEQQVSEKTASLNAQAADLTEALKKAEEATRLKSEFLANMSHEIRTPMNGVLGMLNLLKSSELTSEQEHRINIANSSANSLLTIINDILDFSKIEAGRLELEYIDFDLRNLLGNFAESIALSAQIKGVEIILDLTDIQLSSIKSDPGRIRQILTNIVSNAIKFTEQGEIAILAKLEPTEQNDIYVFTCKIQDTGIGIPEEKIQSLFGVFSQVDASTTRKYGGTGLGLSITKKLCKLLNGDVTVTSEVGKGSCFEITCLVEKSLSAKDIVPPINCANSNVLIVAENQSNRGALRRQLESWGITVTEADSGEQALNYCYESFNSDEGSFFDIALIDFNMTNMNGEALVKSIRANESYKAMKLVMMTSMDEQIDLKHLSAIGANTSFYKPATTNDLVNALSVMHIVSESPSTDHSTKKQQIKSKIAVIEDIINWPESTRILLVEDNRVNQMVALSVLKNINLTADVAVNGIEALKALKNATSKPFTVVIMDCQMPEMDGYEATKKIRDGDAGEVNKNIHIIAMTANAMQGDKEKCLNAGMNDYLTKPINPKSLLKKLRAWLGQDINIP
ncbi:hybrid sensor histidine kinase/response regulator [Litorilituus lipolyticus]|uniref:Sensory/regulatory protein RpfC n=1 Tax=Litorilituus lipolyticus TaxID=2491017 RepID=A0A502L1F1_9GAMM|nr:hybrid sensor histidine kinase/response regulator [Litorilituus lipolyticus]TPH17840.1 hybrid sensor histidine kinase/response regulator [Litorilituus lipolyticus]